jgi:NADPH:quinone reductase-like Zn-dependent oxidoreductase
LVWGGSSSVGATAIQLAVGAGVKVVSVASKHNLDKLKDLGAAAAFDYKSDSVIDDIVSALQGTDFAGVCDCIGSGAPWAGVYEKLGGRYGSVMPGAEGLPDGIEGTSVFAPTVALDDKYIGDVIWAKWVPEALEKGTLRPLPPPIAIKGGLEAVQKGYDEQKKGVSFGKIVVEI